MVNPGKAVSQGGIAIWGKSKAEMAIVNTSTEAALALISVDMVCNWTTSQMYTRTESEHE